MKTELRLNAIRGVFDPANFLFASNDKELVIELDPIFKGEYVLSFNRVLFQFTDNKATVPKDYFAEGTQVVKVTSASGREWKCEGLVMHPFRIDEEQAQKVEQEAIFYKEFVKKQAEEIQSLKDSQILLVRELEKVASGVNALQKDIDTIFIELNS